MEACISYIYRQANTVKSKVMIQFQYIGSSKDTSIMDTVLQTFPTQFLESIISVRNKPVLDTSSRAALLRN